MNEHPPEHEEPDDSDAGYRDTAEERAYEDADDSASFDAIDEEEDEDEEEEDDA